MLGVILNSVYDPSEKFITNFYENEREKDLKYRERKRDTRKFSKLNSKIYVTL